MTNREKNNILDKFELSEIIEDNRLSILRDFSMDSNLFIRSRVPILLMDILSQESLSILITLANDDNPLVRTEAYDSLSVFPFQQAIDSLYIAIQSEQDELARCYAILSWADCVALLSQVTNDKINFAKNQKSNEKSKTCILSWLYSLYKFGDKLQLKEMLNFLKEKDYHLRSFALSLFSELLNEENYAQLYPSIITLLQTEKVPTVRDKANNLLENVKFHNSDIQD